MLAPLGFVPTITLSNASGASVPLPAPTEFPPRLGALS
jgi:hypothetical protein